MHKYLFICKNKHINGLVSEFSKQVLGKMKEHHGAPGKNAPDSKQSPAVMFHSLTSSLLSSPTYSNATLSSGLFLPPTIFHSQTMAMLVPKTLIWTLKLLKLIHFRYNIYFRFI